MKLVTFQHEMLDAAAQLLSARHVRARIQHPALPEQFEQPEQARKALQALLEKPTPLAFAAIHEEQVVGYIIGTLAFSEIRERHLWVDYAGSALAAGVGVELYRDLYAQLAEVAVAKGYFKHYALLPSSDEDSLHAWFRLGFGHEQVHALLTLPSEVEVPALPSGITVRRAGKTDESSVRALAPTIMRHQVGTPVFGIAFPDDAPSLQEGYAGLLDESDVSFWLATRDSEPLGYQVFWPDTASDHNLLTPTSCISLGVGGTSPAARGVGVGTALVRQGFQHAKASGFTNCSTDWRMTNLLSSRFWPRLGFQPVAYRLFRQIDPRIAWADGR
ncbi:GNAT family N-acetyltransferase [Tumebacillus permanentifrigoris]|uniref:Acetyltransferase (GNAT) family protein n=1 Tax=Tumebacillus permanentifrigoris TaxID=378543 RepID=A0A316D801_9BACL|nr:GNAT family N-acetyltransferase [Tumebacillus permanentifrigoris]PWK11561.1 acetyltransferase (GNAT) family protein [Tumebacillus permanentifrigoris]